MQSLTLRTHVGKDGILELKMPIGIIDKDLEVILVVQAVDDVKPVAEWPANFFTKIIGGWDGAPLTREPQGNYETRSEFK
jgi:hypothetical protein